MPFGITIVTSAEKGDSETRRFCLSTESAESLGVIGIAFSQKKFSESVDKLGEKASAFSSQAGDFVAAQTEKAAKSDFVANAKQKIAAAKAGAQGPVSSETSADAKTAAEQPAKQDNAAS